MLLKFRIFKFSGWDVVHGVELQMLPCWRKYESVIPRCSWYDYNMSEKTGVGYMENRDRKRINTVTKVLNGIDVSS